MAASAVTGPSFQDGEATPEVRIAHQEAFDKAVAVLEAELESIAQGGKVVAILVAVKNEFEAWDDGQIDGPMPALATSESLRAQKCLQMLHLCCALNMTSPLCCTEYDFSVVSHCACLKYEMSLEYCTAHIQCTDGSTVLYCTCILKS